MAQVLILEPDQLLSDIYMRALEHAGYTVRASATAQGAVQLADETTPDVVVLELQLVEHSGIEFLYEFRSYTDWKHIPVVVHSMVPVAEFSGNTDMLRQHLGVVSYYYKPSTTLAQLQQAVEAALVMA